MNFFRSSWFIAIVIFLIILFGFGSARSFFRNNAIQKEINQLEEKQSALQSERSNLSILLKKIQTDAYAQTQAREQFGLRFPGEKSIVIKDVEENLDEDEKKQKEENNIGNAKKWWLYFFQKIDTNRS